MWTQDLVFYEPPSPTLYIKGEEISCNTIVLYSIFVIILKISCRKQKTRATTRQDKDKDTSWMLFRYYSLFTQVHAMQVYPKKKTMTIEEMMVYFVAPIITLGFQQ